MRSIKSSVVIAVSFVASVVSFASLAQANEHVSDPFESELISDMTLYTSLNYGTAVAPKSEPVFDFTLSVPKSYVLNEVGAKSFKQDLKVALANGVE